MIQHHIDLEFLVCKSKFVKLEVGGEGGRRGRGEGGRVGGGRGGRGRERGGGEEGEARRRKI